MRIAILRLDTIVRTEEALGVELIGVSVEPQILPQRIF